MIAMLKLNPTYLRLYAGHVGAEDDGVEVLHDETNRDPTLSMLLARCEAPDFPTPIGVLRAVDEPTFDGKMREQTQVELARDDGGLGGPPVRRRPVDRLERLASSSSPTPLAASRWRGSAQQRPREGRRSPRRGAVSF